MSELTTVRTATTPMQAKLLVALLESEGIAATVEGESLADQVAISRRLLNTAGTEVKVRTEDLARAQEVLAAAAAAVDDAELEKQALAAAPEASPAPAPRPTGTMPHFPFVLIGAFLGGLATWMARDVIEATTPPGPFHDYQVIDGGLREVWRQDPAYYVDLLDDDRDGFYERQIEHTPSGELATTTDADGDGRFDLRVLRDATGTEVHWSPSPGSDTFDLGTVKDPQGKVLQRLRWLEGRGYEVNDG